MADVATSSNLAYVRRLRTFLALGDFELHLVAFLQTLVSLGGDRAIVNENIGAICATDKPVAFCVIEPLDGSFQTFHVPPSFCTSFLWGAQGRARSSYDAFWSGSLGLSRVCMRVPWLSGLPDPRN